MDIAIWRYVTAFSIVVATLFIRKFINSFVLGGMQKGLAKTTLEYSRRAIESLKKPINALVIWGGLVLAVTVLGLPESVEDFLHSSYLVALGIIVIWAFYRLVGVFSDYLEHGVKGSSFDRQLVPLIRKSLRAFVVLIGTLTILSSLHVDVGSLLAGLGIGGLAVALAAQDALGNLFGSIVLLSDRPFKLGDWIEVGSKINGMVETIGMRSTTVRSLSNSLITIPNKMLASEVIINWSRMWKRRVQQTVGVTYDSRPDQIQALVAKIDEILRADEGVNQDRVIVRFADFGAYSLDIVIDYFTTGIRKAEYLGTKERINLKIMEAVASLNMSIAFPTQTIHKV